MSEVINGIESRESSSSTYPNEKVTPLVDVQGVNFAYPGHDQVLHDVTFKVAPGELVTLLGPNGAGKSTLLNCIMNLLTPQSGTIFLDGRMNLQMERREIAQMVSGSDVTEAAISNAKALLKQ